MATILVVEDDSAMFDPIRMWLTYRGYDVVVAVDGSQGIEAFKRLRPNVSLVDIHMPGLDGFSVVEAIRREDPEAPVVVMSGVVNERMLNMALALGAAATLRKPFVPEQLEEAIEAAIAKAGTIPTRDPMRIPDP